MPGPIHGVLTAGSSHIHLGVAEGGEGKDGEEAKDCGSFSLHFLLCSLKAKQNKTPNKKQTQEDNYKGNSQVTQWIDNSWNITEKLCLPLVSIYK